MALTSENGPVVIIRQQRGEASHNGVVKVGHISVAVLENPSGVTRNDKKKRDLCQYKFILTKIMWKCFYLGYFPTSSWLSACKKKKNIFG